MNTSLRYLPHTLRSAGLLETSSLGDLIICDAKSLVTVFEEGSQRCPT